MRITTNMVYDRNLSSLNGANERLSTAYEQLMTGNKFKTAGKILRHEPEAGADQRDRPVQAVRGSAACWKQPGPRGDGADLTNTAMTSAQTLIQKSNNSAMDLEERKAIASELEGCKSRCST